MVECAIDEPQFKIYHNSLNPISHYYLQHQNDVPSDAQAQKLLPYAKQTDFILSTFLEIVDDLAYDKEKFENIIFSFDDDYDMLKNFVSTLNPTLKSHSELVDVSEKILTNLIKAQNELGIIISQTEASMS